MKNNIRDLLCDLGMDDELFDIFEKNIIEHEMFLEKLLES